MLFRLWSLNPFDSGPSMQSITAGLCRLLRLQQEDIMEALHEQQSDFLRTPTDQVVVEGKLRERPWAVSNKISWTEKSWHTLSKFHGGAKRGVPMSCVRGFSTDTEEPPVLYVDVENTSENGQVERIICYTKRLVELMMRKYTSDRRNHRS